MKTHGAERSFRWFCRGLATIGFIYMLLTVGFEAENGAYMLLLGLFFGPEAVSKLRRNDT